MKTVAIIFGYFFLCTPLKFIGKRVMKIVGLPGSLIAFKVTSKKQPRYITGLIICIVAHVYIYLAFMIYIMNWTRHLINPDSISKYFIWFFCFILLSVVMEGIYRTAKNEANEKKAENINTPNYLNPQIASLYSTRIFVFIGFWIFLFFPEFTNPLWRWVNAVGFLI
jgi:uncharacterized membrane protein (DUF485 family)